MTLFATMRDLYAGKTLARILLERALAGTVVSGRVVDVGGGRDPHYLALVKKAPGATIEAVDGSISGIDFERDPLPYESASVGTLLCMNTLEHVFDHRHLLKEMRRVLVEGGSVIGFVPFWVGYHPDPHDFFRYTDEALSRLLGEAGFSDVRINALGGGPLAANFNTIVLSVPRVLRPPLYLWYACFDWLFVTLRPKSITRNPLGFLFTAHA